MMEIDQLLRRRMQNMSHLKFSPEATLTHSLTLGALSEPEASATGLGNTLAHARRSDGAGLSEPRFVG